MMNSLEKETKWNNMVSRWITKIKDKCKPYLLAALMATSALQSCSDFTIEVIFSNPKKTSGIVYNKEYKEASSNPVTTSNFINSGDAGSFMMDEMVEEEEEFKIYIKTDTDTFIVENNKDLYQKLAIDSKVDITYREAHELRYKEKEDWKKELVENYKMKNEILDIKPQKN